MVQFRFSYDDSYVDGAFKLTGAASAALYVGSILAYVAFCYFCKLLAGSSTINSLRKAHNIFMSFSSFLVFAYTLYIFIVEGHFESFRDMVCKVPSSSSTHFPEAVLLFIVSKVFEWFDTMFLIADNKTPRMVHLIHHATTFWLFGVGSIFYSSIKFGLLLNCFVHFVMYYHYAFPLPTWCRKYITRMQIVQFMLCIVIHSLNGYYYECEKELFDKYYYEFNTIYFFVLSYLILFINFYVQQYLKRAATKADKSK